MKNFVLPAVLFSLLFFSASAHGQERPTINALASSVSEFWLALEEGRYEEACEYFSPRAKQGVVADGVTDKHCEWYGRFMRKHIGEGIKVVWSPTIRISVTHQGLIMSYAEVTTVLKYRAARFGNSCIVSITNWTWIDPGDKWKGEVRVAGWYIFMMMESKAPCLKN